MWVTFSAVAEYQRLKSTPKLKKVNIMMKNVVDVVLGGVSYWAIGYGLSYGSDTVSITACIITSILLSDKISFTLLAYILKAKKSAESAFQS